MGSYLSCASCSTADDKSLHERMSLLKMEDKSNGKTLSRRKDKRNRMNMNSLKILNVRSTAPVTSFVNRLQNDLEEKHNIKVNKIETLTEVQPEEILVIICNRNEAGPIDQAVEKCLEGVEHDFYRRIVLVVLHVIREDKLPVLSSRDEIQAIKDYSDLGCVIDMGFQDGSIYSCKTNETAFKKLAHFYSYYSSMYNDPNADADQCTSEKVQTKKKDKINIRSKPGTSENGLSGVERHYNDSPERKTLEKVYERDILCRENYTSNRKGTFLRMLKILNNRTSTPATLFAKMLQNDLEKKYNIKAIITETWKQLQPEELLVLICNRNQYRTIEQAVEKCLQDVESDLYQRIILIVLHVKRQDHLPKMSSRGELQVHQDYSEVGCVVDMGFQDGNIYSCEMNDSAFTEISHFCLKDNSAYSESKIQTVEDHQASKKGRNINMKQASTECRNITGPIMKTVYIFNPSNTRASKLFIESFQERMKEFGILLSEKQITDAKDLDPELFAIIVCNNTTRIQSDIKENLCPEMRQLRNRTVLLVLHVVRLGRESTESTEKSLVGASFFEECNSLFSIIDMAFTEEDGIYECSMNEKAMADLQKIYDEIFSFGLKGSANN